MPYVHFGNILGILAHMGSMLGAPKVKNVISGKFKFAASDQTVIKKNVCQNF